MAISLSEQLESDIKEYLHKTFGTYFSSLDERFAADIKKDVISASDFHHEHYNDDDISIAFQRVTLGRMGHLDWQIYHLCTDMLPIPAEAFADAGILHDNLRVVSVDGAVLVVSDDRKTKWAAELDKSLEQLGIDRAGFEKLVKAVMELDEDENDD